MTPIRIAAAALFAACLFGMAGPAQAGIEVRVSKSAQRMAVIIDGVNTYSWPVSTGLGGGPPSGTYTPERLERKWFSRTFNWAPMPYSIFFDGPYAIHGTNHVKNLGRRASKGCVRLHPDNAAILFNLVAKRGMKNTRIVVEHGVAASIDQWRNAKRFATIR
jgi:lipoprotein-anchoring transpeptidase ErfK/SrfK